MPTNPTLPSPPVVRLADGAELIARAGRIWRRAGAGQPWSSVHTLTDEAPVISPGLRGTGSAYCLDASAVYTVDSGLTWQSGPPDDVLPPAIAAWPRGASGVRALLMAPGGPAAAMDRSGRAYLSWDGSRDLSYIDTDFAPIVLRAPNGLWYAAFITSTGLYLEQYAAYSGGAWVWVSAHTGEVPGSGAVWRSLCLWVGASGLQVVTGFHSASATMRVMSRRGFRPTNGDWSWSAPTEVASSDYAGTPYVVELLTGQWEIGWYTGSAWRRFRADHPGGTWTEVSP